MFFSKKSLKVASFVFLFFFGAVSSEAWAQKETGSYPISFSTVTYREFLKRLGRPLPHVRFDEAIRELKGEIGNRVSRAPLSPVQQEVQTNVAFANSAFARSLNGMSPEATAPGRQLYYRLRREAEEIERQSKQGLTQSDLVLRDIWNRLEDDTFHRFITTTQMLRERLETDFKSSIVASINVFSDGESSWTPLDLDSVPFDEVQGLLAYYYKLFAKYQHIVYTLALPGRRVLVNWKPKQFSVNVSVESFDHFFSQKTSAEFLYQLEQSNVLLNELSDIITGERFRNDHVFNYGTDLQRIVVLEGISNHVRFEENRLIGTVFPHNLIRVLPPLDTPIDPVVSERRGSLAWSLRDTEPSNGPLVDRTKQPLLFSVESGSGVPLPRYFSVSPTERAHFTASTRLSLRKVKRSSADVILQGRQGFQLPRSRVLQIPTPDFHSLIHVDVRDTNGRRLLLFKKDYEVFRTADGYAFGIRVIRPDVAAVFIEAWFSKDKPIELGTFKIDNPVDPDYVEKLSRRMRRAGFIALHRALDATAATARRSGQSVYWRDLAKIVSDHSLYSEIPQEKNGNNKASDPVLNSLARFNDGCGNFAAQCTASTDLGVRLLQDYNPQVEAEGLVSYVQEGGEIRLAPTHARVAILEQGRLARILDFTARRKDPRNPSSKEQFRALSQSRSRGYRHSLDAERKELVEIFKESPHKIIAREHDPTVRLTRMASVVSRFLNNEMDFEQARIEIKEIMPRGMDIRVSSVNDLLRFVESQSKKEIHFLERADESRVLTQIQPRVRVAAIALARRLTAIGELKTQPEVHCARIL